MVIWDPDALEIEEAETIGIFEPGAFRERSMNLSQVIKVVGYTILGLVLMIIVGIPVLLLMIPYGLVEINLVTGSVRITAMATALLGITEIVLIVPPLYYIRKRKFSLETIGIKTKNPAREIAWGVLIGGFMVLINIILSWVLDQLRGVPHGTDTSMFAALTMTDVIALSLVMMLVVGPTEEILFRGFLQRRLETYYYAHRKNFRLWALAMASFIFAVTHLDVAGLGVRFILGVILGYFAQRQKYSLLGPAVAHGLNNSMVVILAFFGF